MIESMLEGEGIRYFVHNDHFGNLYVGLKIDLYNAKTIMVSEDQFEIAQDITNDFLKIIKKTKTYESNYSILDKFRLLIEMLMIHWVIPGHRWNKGRRNRK